MIKQVSIMRVTPGIINLSEEWVSKLIMISGCFALFRYGERFFPDE